MPPTEGAMVVAQNPMGMGVGTISLATLIDFIVQRTYHEMVVLSEILPRKTDMERKIEIVQYASRTRQLFIRLLALVKWANSASKVDKCAKICNFLEQQSMYFIETADTLAKMSRETLVNARLPNFSLPCAIDVLTLGTYPRLPTCIREKIVPPDPITSSEKKQVLQRLNQVIQYRLVSSELPKHMRKLKIENGRVKFLVEHEFQVTLTLMEDSPVIPWRLLHIDILVENHETGDGKALVHSLQVGYIHRVAQSRLLDNDKPLHDLYRAQKLIRERLGDSLYIDEYSVGKCLTVSYWRDFMKKEKEKVPDAIRYRLSVHVNEEDDDKQLCVSHTPAMLPDECRRVGTNIHSEHLSLERLLMTTVEVRTRTKLKDLAYSIQRFIEGKCEIRDLPLALHVPVLHPCTSTEQLRITIDAQRGMMMASLPSIDLPVLKELEDSLNGDRKVIQKHLVKLRLHLTMLRCERSVECLHTVARQQLPLVNKEDHPIKDLPPQRLYITVPKQTNHHVDSPPRSVQFHYHMLETTPSTAEGEGIQEGGDDPNPVTAFMKAGKLLLLGEYVEPMGKKLKTSPYIVPELVHVVAACEEKLPFVFLGHELKENKVLCTNIQVDKQAMGFVMDIIMFPDVAGVSKEDCDTLRRSLLSCKIRMVTKPFRTWQVEFLFTASGLDTRTDTESGPTQRVFCSYQMDGGAGKMVTDLLNDWAAMCHLFSIIKSYNYKKITLQYGMAFSSLIHILWRCDQKQFVLSFGRQGYTSPMNPHVPMATQLQHDLNTSRSLSYLVQSPKQSIQCFTVIPQSSTHVRISYRNQYCLDVHFRSTNVVAVRDGAYSLFDTSKATEGFTPIPMLKAFLGMFVDESVTGGNLRRRSTTEDDNPPSPIGMDNMDVFSIPASHQATGSPGARQRADGIAPSPSTYIGTPSPGALLATGSPGNPHLHVPSPGSFVPAPSPSSLGIHMQSPASFISPQGVGDTGSPYPGNLAMPSPGQRSNWPNSPSVPGPSPASRHGGMAPSPGYPTLHSPQNAGKDDHGKASVMSPPSRILPQRQWAASTPTLLSHEAFDTLLKPTPIQQLPLHMPLSPLERFLGCKFIRRHIVRAISQEKHVACPPYKSNSLTAFGRLLKANINILKDVIQIMRLELLQLTQIQPPSQPGQPQREPISITIPLLYSIQDNNITLVEKGTTNTNHNLVHVSQHLKRYMDSRFHQSGECAIFPAVRDLLTNLIILSLFHNCLIVVAMVMVARTVYIFKTENFEKHKQQQQQKF
ncbi:MED14-like protein [Mya arenaria]|uniref:Mediator of RNA polymerase II transcription subunit 14 n=1 Tax=Mya arenaria TaxID=6604 RepID=A0ABY7EJS0_MYAAR|nr:MED14-like protein [Mya arenaria]